MTGRNLLFLSLLVITPILHTCLYVFLPHPSLPNNPSLSFTPPHLPTTQYFSPTFGYSFGPGYHFRWGSSYPGTIPSIAETLENGAEDKQHTNDHQNFKNSKVSQLLNRIATQNFKNSKVSPFLTKLQSRPTGRETGVLLA